MKCSICGFDRDCEEIVLSDVEKRQYEKFGVKPPDACYYCAPCLRMAQDAEQGPRLIQGFFCASLRNIGAANSGLTSERLYQRIQEIVRAKSS